ncbi:hypothetical protein PIB30_044433 [Stylosanthes scabra]|uniref:Caffeoyl-CoA O-methyltransferase n=1 Tax=Stylosanthes scabra TaxID=79078 RepID=A0ABU6QG28_9FABA|nr:hypothetical protein [Stylosanthes scabra]
MENIEEIMNANFPVILQSDKLAKYIVETAVYPREAQLLKELRERTENYPRGNMGTSPDSGQLISILLKLLNAKKTIEIGVFTGYSLLLTALNIPHDGKITAIDIDRKAYEVGLPFIKKAGVEHKIDFIESPALPILDKLVQDPSNLGTYDFAFIDADKWSYMNYHERLIKLVKVGGLLAYDDTLLGGFVVWPEEDVEAVHRPFRKAAIEVNQALANDHRVEIALTPVGDGLTICRRIA